MPGRGPVAFGPVAGNPLGTAATNIANLVEGPDGVASTGVVSGAVSTPVGFDPALTAQPPFALSNQNRTLTFVGTGGSYAVAVSPFKSTGKWYAEMRVSTGGGTQIAVGVVNQLESPLNPGYLGQSNNGFGSYPNGALGDDSSGYDTFGPTWAANDIIRLAIDVATGMCFVAVNAGPWYGNPLTVTGGWTLPRTGPTPSFAFAAYLSIGGGPITINHGAAGHAYPPPTGYSTMDAATPTGRTANAALVEGADAIASTGAARMTALSTVAEAADTMASAGAGKVVGAGAVVEGADTTTATVKAIAKGTATVTEAADVASSTAVARITAASVAAELPDTMASQGSAPAAGAVANLFEGADTPTATGTLRVAGNAATVEAADTTTSSGSVRVVASASTAEAPDSLTATAIARATAAAALAEADDAATSTAALRITGAAALTEAPDAIASASTGGVTGTAPLVEAPDTTASDGRAFVFGFLSQAEAGDSSTSSGAVRIIATGAIAEAADAMASTAAPRVFADATIAEGDDVATSSALARVRATAIILEAADFPTLPLLRAPDTNTVELVDQGAKFATLYDAGARSITWHDTGARTATLY
jgi:hypothetical protein